MKSRHRGTRSKYTFAIFFSAPAVIIYSLFFIVPLGGVVGISLTHWNGAGPMQFIGTANFRALFSSVSPIYQVLYNTAILVALHILIQIPMALLLAYLLYRTSHGFRFFRAVYFIPGVIAGTCIALMFSVLLNSDIGPFNRVLDQMGLHALAKNWLSDSVWALYTVSLVTVWQYIGYHVTLLFAAMQSVPEENIDSATIDGASSPQIFFRIMIPSIQGMLKFCLLFSVTGCLKQFDQTFIMTWGGPSYSSTFLTIYLWKLAFLDGNLGMSTAVGLLIIVLALMFNRVLDVLIREV